MWYLWALFNNLSAKPHPSSVPSNLRCSFTLYRFAHVVVPLLWVAIRTRQPPDDFAGPRAGALTVIVAVTSSTGAEVYSTPALRCAGEDSITGRLHKNKMLSKHKADRLLGHCGQIIARKSHHCRRVGSVCDTNWNVGDKMAYGFDFQVRLPTASYQWLCHAVQRKSTICGSTLA